jgi:ATP:corrinoid adenosyltransferase
LGRAIKAIAMRARYRKKNCKRKTDNRKKQSSEVSGFLIVTVGVSKATFSAAGVVNRGIHNGHHVVMFIALEAARYPACRESVETA